MTKKKIIFRADGNSSTGLGHLYRIFSLVEIVKDTFDFICLTHESSVRTIIPETYKTNIIPQKISSEQEADWLVDRFNPEDHIIIADGYQFNSSYQKAVKEKGFTLIYIDDLVKEHMYADIVINHAPSIEEEVYSKETYTTIARGTQYALLRPGFLDLAKKERKINTIDTVFVCFGGTDPFNLTYKAVKALFKIDNIKAIHIVLGGAYKHTNVLALKSDSKKVHVHKNLTEEELIKVMLQCNFAIAPASTILYELCCVKMPILSGYYVANQELIYDGFSQNKAIFKAGNIEKYSEEDFLRELGGILDKNNFEEQLIAQSNLFDGQIKERHIKIINSLC